MHMGLDINHDTQTAEGNRGTRACKELRGGSGCALQPIRERRYSLSSTVSLTEYNTYAEDPMISEDVSFCDSPIRPVIVRKSVEPPAAPTTSASTDSRESFLQPGGVDPPLINARTRASPTVDFQGASDTGTPIV